MKKIIALAALATISATASAGNLFSDGSFESLSSGGSWAVDTGLTDGWTVGLAPATATGGNPVGLEVRQSGVAGTAKDGSKFIELDGYQNDMIKQSLSTVIGQTYKIVFYFADRPDLTSDQMDVTGGWAATVGDVAGASFDGSVGTKWHKETITFKADSKSTLFSIWATGTSDQVGTSFDQFTATAVPEPATLGLFAAGLAMLGLSSRRRSR